METLARFIVSAVDVVEAEGRVLRREVFRLTVTLGLTLVSLLLAATGLGFLVFGIFQGLSIALGPAWGSITMGMVWLFVAWMGMQYLRARL